MSLSLTVRVWSYVGQIVALSQEKSQNKRTKITPEKCKKQCMCKNELGINRGKLHSDHRALLLPEVWVRWLVVGGDHVGCVPPSHRCWGVLHHHQSDGRLSGLWVRGVLLGRIFAPTVIHYTGYQEDEEQDNVAGDKDAKVQSDGVNLLVVFQKAHDACLMLGGPEGPETSSSVDGEAEGVNSRYTPRTLSKPGDSRALSLYPLQSALPPCPPSILSASLLSSSSSLCQTSAVDVWLWGKNTLILISPPTWNFCHP